MLEQAIKKTEILYFKFYKITEDKANLSGSVSETKQRQLLPAIAPTVDNKQHTLWFVYRTLSNTKREISSRSSVNMFYQNLLFNFY